MTSFRFLWKELSLLDSSPFILVALLISLGLCLIWLTLLLAQRLPSISKDLADLA
jgi:hypothetical protein